MKLEELTTLIQEVSRSGLQEFCYEEGETRIRMKKAKGRKSLGHPEKSELMEHLEEPVDPLEEELPPEGKIIVSPLVGTFYLAPGEGEEPFAQVGSSIKKGQTLGIIEAMKLMNEVESTEDGILEKILVENEQMVEYGQPLFVLK